MDACLTIWGERRFVRRVQKKLEEKFQEVKAFLEENPNSSVETVAEELDVIGEADPAVDSRGASVTFRGRSRRHCL